MIKTFKLTQISKLTISAIFIALVIVFSKILSIGDIPGIPFLRISLGPCLLIFASLLVGPIYGGLVGFLSDLIGYFAFDKSGFAYNPLFSITYILYGVLPWLLVFLVRLNKKYKMPILQFLLFFVLDFIVIYFISTNTEFKLYATVYQIDIYLRSIIICGSILITFLYFLLYYFLYKRFKNNDDRVLLNNISLLVLFILLLVQVGIGVYIKYITYSVDAFVLIATQIIATLIEIFICNYLILLLYKASSSMFKVYIKKQASKKTNNKEKLKKIIKEELNNLLK